LKSGDDIAAEQPNWIPSFIRMKITTAMMPAQVAFARQREAESQQVSVMARHEGFEHAFKIDQPVQQHGQDGGVGRQRNHWPPGCPAEPSSVRAYTIFTLAAVILGKMLHMSIRSADLASEQDELPRPKTIVFMATPS